jgi:GWxTD domain-containing protein
MNKHFRSRLTSLVAVICATSGFSQQRVDTYESPLAGDEFFGKPSFMMRAFAFPGGGSGKANIEIRLSMVYDLLQFVKEAPDRYHAAYEMTAAIVDAKSNEVAGKILRNEITVRRYEDTNSRVSTCDETIRLDVPPGEYTLTLDIMDRDTQKHLRREEELKISDFVGGQLQVSTLAFVNYTRPVAVRDSLSFNLGNTLRPRRELHAIYFELADISGDSVAVQYTVRNQRDEQIDRWSEKLPAGVASHLVDMEKWIRTPGQYGIEVYVRDNKTERTRKESFVVMSSPESNGVKTLPAATGLFEPLRYIAKSAEYKKIASAPQTQRDSLVADFWKQRDPSPDTPENELFEEYNRRLDFAIANFSVAQIGRSGWQTDRGRIFIQNGQPTDVQRQMPSPRGGARYEIWYYKTLDRSFIFRERSEGGDYELVGQQ